MKKSNLIAAICLILVAVVSLVYFFVFEKEDEEKDKEIAKDVKISAVKEDTSDGFKTNEMKFENTSITLDVTINHPGSSAIYNVTITNSKDKDVTLKAISGIEAANNLDPEALKYEVSDIQVGDVIEAGDSLDFKIKATWDGESSESGSLTKKTTISFTFE